MKMEFYLLNGLNKLLQLSCRVDVFCRDHYSTEPTILTCLVMVKFKEYAIIFKHCVSSG
jgi:hypothetical protein